VKDEHRKPVIGIVIGAALALLAPMVGALFTALGVSRAFSAVAGADPSLKASLLAAGIGASMRCSALGLGVGLFGLVVLIVSVVVLLSGGRAARRREPQAPHLSNGSDVAK